jgi:hypothetical protein
MTLPQIRTILESQGFNAEEVEEKTNAIRKHRAELRGQKIKHHRSVTYWRYLRTPLKREIDICRTSIEYIERKNLRGEDLDETDNARREAYEAYALVLTSLLRRFDEFIEINPSMTPIQVLNQEQEAGKWRFVTRGEHWADWIPDKAKAPVLEMFASIPHRVRAKTKIPFERKVPKGSQRSRRTMLEQAMAKELETLRATHAAYEPDRTMSEALQDEMRDKQDKVKAKMRKIRQAQDILHRKRDNQPFPATWHGLLKEGESNE